MRTPLCRHISLRWWQNETKEAVGFQNGEHLENLIAKLDLAIVVSHDLCRCGRHRHPHIICLDNAL